mmetsp:Transcript_9749/g.23808  ORF Transcript_9749/g.23808 Transcript_9749/m.23808 type:complete len:304 (-) Transcript_9749:1003-1914(-)
MPHSSHTSRMASNGSNAPATVVAAVQLTKKGRLPASAACCTAWARAWGSMALVDGNTGTCTTFSTPRPSSAVAFSIDSWPCSEVNMTSGGVPYTPFTLTSGTMWCLATLRAMTFDIAPPGFSSPSNVSKGADSFRSDRRSRSTSTLGTTSRLTSPTCPHRSLSPVPALHRVDGGWFWASSRGDCDASVEASLSLLEVSAGGGSRLGADSSVVDAAVGCSAGEGARRSPQSENSCGVSLSCELGSKWVYQPRNDAMCCSSRFSISRNTGAISKVRRFALRQLERQSAATASGSARANSWLKKYK